MNDQLIDSFNRIFEHAYRLFQDKNADYGPTWLLYRPQSLNDEIWRKAKRIRTLEEHDGRSCIPEGRDSEYIGIINYCIMFLMKLDTGLDIPSDQELVENISILDTVSEDTILAAYRRNTETVRDLLIRKNTDYGDAWRSMTLGSMTDQVIIRVYRIRKILSRNGSCRVSEGIASQLQDIINYCVFALIKMDAEIVNPT